jgi:DNA-binding NarL/FixJ family response regulator
MKPLIFIVDDDVFFQKYIASVLMVNNYDNIRSFNSGESCIRNLKLCPDIIILDHDMNGMSGTEVMKYLKANNIKIPVIMVSGREDKELIANVISLGVHKYFKKDGMLVSKLKEYFSKNYSQTFSMI